MKSIELLTAIGEVKNEYVQDILLPIQTTQRNNSSVKSRGSAKKSFRRSLLVAAIIMLLALLVGCAVLYFSSIHETWVGAQDLFYDRYDPDTFEFLDRYYYTEQMFSATGTNNSPAFCAAQEWFSFIQNYDPDRAIRRSVWGNEPEFPPEYYSYNIYTQEMKDRLDEIIEKYGLKLAGKKIELNNVFELCETLGLKQSVIDHPDVLLGIQSGSCFENGNFYLILHFSIQETLDGKYISTWGNLSWNRKDCFSDDVISFEDTGDWTEWYYTTTSGNKVLIVRSPSSSQCYIIFNRKEAIMSLELDTRYYQDWDNDANSLYLSDQQVEQITDVVDFSIHPNH